MDRNQSIPSLMSEPVTQKQLQKLFHESVLHEPGDAVGFLIWRATMAYQRRAEEALAAVGVTHLQFAVLATSAWLGQRNAEVSQRSIVDQSGIREAQVSLMIKALRQKEFLTQTLGERDPRVRAIKITSEGMRVLEDALQVIGALNEHLWPSRKERETVSGIVTGALTRWGEV